MAKDKTITVMQTASSARRHHSQRETLIGLGLNKIGRSRDLPDTPATRGMVTKVQHLVTIVDGNKASASKSAASKSPASKPAAK